MKAPIKSDGTDAKSDAEVIGSNIFFAPESRHTCNIFASSDTFMIVPPILKFPKITALEITGLFSAADQMATKVANVKSEVIPIPFMS